MRIKQIDASEKNLITELDAAAQLPAPAAEAYRARIRERFTDLYTERQTITTQLKALAHHTAQHGNDPTLLDELPELTTRIEELPERIQAGLFAAFDIQILRNPPMKQATFYATITDTTPSIITALLTRANDDDPATASTTSGSDEATTGSDTFSVSPRTGVRGKPPQIPCGVAYLISMPSWRASAGASARN